ncbi:hypothetical protein V491_04922 [Pseudogymnoascus sp. VKM F-3775]|nr:hypothetical protein V491_04922 [Pseudogymnoascus sp. VKM F-3775]
MLETMENDHDKTADSLLITIPTTGASQSTARSTPPSPTCSVWEDVIAKLDAYVLTSIWTYLRGTNLKVGEGEEQLDPEPTREVCARYRNIIVSDREKYDSASIDEVAGHFTDWTGDPNNDQSSNFNTNVCLLIDAEVLSRLQNAPPAATEVRIPELADPDQTVCIKAIDTLFDPDDMSECDPRYRGWVLARPNML